MAAASLAVKEGIAPVRDRLMTMGFFAALLHGIVILGVTFGAPGGNGTAPGLQVLLVSTEVPEADRNDDATYLAQRTQLGSGSGDAVHTPRSQARPGSAQPPEPPGEAGAQASERVLTANVQRSTMVWIGTIATPHEQPRPPALPDVALPDAIAGEDLETSELAGKERKELWITPDTRESSLAPYLDAWRRKVERLGTLNFPAAARRSPDATSPVLEVAIDSKGQLTSAVIQRSSGSPELDAAAISILRLASPFEPFPRELAANYRVLRFAYAWEFAAGGTTSGTVTAPADSR